MTSILTNNSAMVALQALKGINSNLGQVQSEISTGKAVSSAKDNAAVWAISKTMESDVDSFKGVTDSLALGSSTVAVARAAAETTTDLLTEMRTKIIAAQGGSDADRTKLQTDIEGLKEQINSVLGAAQFNGVNLVSGGDDMEVLSSLNRTAGGVDPQHITVKAQDLSTGGYVAKAVFTAGATVSTAGDSAGFSMDATTGTGDLAIDPAATFAAGDKVSLTIGGKTASYTVSDADLATGNSTADLVALGLKSAVDKLGIEGLTVAYDSANPGELAFANAGGTDMRVSAQFSNAGAGDLAGISQIDVSTDAAGALDSIDGLLKVATDAAAAFGASEKRLSMQSDFVGKLSDSLKSGIGSLVDANMEEASARLQALQVQQQLGVQALSIANQAPQTIMSLFR